MSDGQIFRLFGLVYLVIGLGMFVNPEFYKKLYEDFAENRGVLYIGGLIALSIGFLLVTFHNVWGWYWGVILTVVGWLAVIKGVVILLLPKAMVTIIKWMTKESGLLLIPVTATILGLFFLILGFWVV
jgi:uncharacterized protein YjeT (DUF2065 family)